MWGVRQQVLEESLQAYNRCVYEKWVRKDRRRCVYWVAYPSMAIGHGLSAQGAHDLQSHTMAVAMFRLWFLHGMAYRDIAILRQRSVAYTHMQIASTIEKAVAPILSGESVRDGGYSNGYPRTPKQIRDLARDCLLGIDIRYKDGFLVRPSNGRPIRRELLRDPCGARTIGDIAPSMADLLVRRIERRVTTVAYDWTYHNI